MKPLSGKTEWPPIAVYDIEATEWVNVCLLCHVDELGNRVHFPSVSEYIDWLFSDAFESQHVWAHAGGRYDHRFLLPEIQQRGWNFRVALSGGTIVLLIAWSDSKKVYFADSFRIMPNALKTIGKTIGLEKLDVDRSHMEKLSPEERLVYCFRDCDIALKGLQLMRDSLCAVNADFAYTLASIAARWVRRSDSIDWGHFCQGTARKNDQMELADQFCEPAYFGGRTEMFRRGTIDGPIYYYDIVSSYPTSMRHELPLYFAGMITAPKQIGHTSSDKRLMEYLSHPGITEAWVDVPACRAAPLCVRYEGRLTFPYGSKIGRQETLPFPAACHCGHSLKSHQCPSCGVVHPKHRWLPGRWTNVELTAALMRGASVYPIVQARFKGKPFLNHFVNTFYTLRKRAKKEKDAHGTYAYKIFLNSLYGKLVETVERTSYVTSREEIERAKKMDADIRSTATPGVYAIHNQSVGPFRHVAAGAYVTAYSRLALLEGLEAAMALGGEIYYCDTDSIMTNVKLDHMEGSELGQWNLEHTFRQVEILLPKVYKAETMEGKLIYRCKGVPIVRENEPEYFPELRWQAFKEYQRTKDPEMARLLGRDGLTGFVADINAGTLNPRTTTLLRCLQGSDRKRAWQGNDSWPLKIVS